MSRACRVLVFLLIAAALVAPNLTDIHRAQNTDSLMPVMVSLIHWTPFVWGQSRYGMLVPFLGAWIADPFLNVLFQVQFNLISLFVIILTFPCRADFSLPSLPSLPANRLASSCLAFTLLIFVLKIDETVYRLLFLPGLPYSVSLALLSVGLWAACKPANARHLWTWIAFALLLFLSIYVNEANFPLAVALAAIYPWSWRNRITALLLVLIAEMAVRALVIRSGSAIPFSLAPLAYFPTAMLNMFDQLLQRVVHPLRITLLTLAALAILLTNVLRRRMPALQLYVLAATILSAFGVACLITSSTWVAANLYDVKYWTTPFLLIVIPITLTVAQPLASGALRLLKRPEYVTLASACLMLAAVILAFGPPSPQRARNALLAATDSYAEPLSRLHCTHMIGDVWKVWPAVLYRQMTGGAPLYAVTWNAEAVRYQWASLPDTARKYCGICNDPDVEADRRLFGLPPLQVEQSEGGLCLLSPTPVK